ncbi:hypothetical protein CY34DRAFT_724124 [Suillus luteus UH-Slu-Lm8-n1]|uniref:Uncharacterized protein n=1 Tax=Suillus luteus UH-Slu-Lm8-n1 TaxID=930992 RepID=A0A0C9ZZW2_9AGAM|nr:hypothetical protein CY34DRAFT_724124 [Suillus luteus UH-Slu-Lm8-n1]
MYLSNRCGYAGHFSLSIPFPSTQYMHVLSSDLVVKPRLYRVALVCKRRKLEAPCMIKVYGCQKAASSVLHLLQYTHSPIPICVIIMTYEYRSSQNVDAIRTKSKIKSILRDNFLTCFQPSYLLFYALFLRWLIIVWILSDLHNVCLTCSCLHLVQLCGFHSKETIPLNLNISSTCGTI